MAKLMRNGTFWLAIVISLGASWVHGAAMHASTNVRVDNNRIREVIEYAIKRSPSFGDLLATLDTLDRIVYIEEGTCHHRELRGCLLLMPTPGGRNIVVRIDPRQPILVVVAQLAHELYHALEVAREPDVVDESGIRSLYEQIGERSCTGNGGDCFETRAAVAFEALVTRQLHGSKELLNLR
jgi:hypothetical protein